MPSTASRPTTAPPRNAPSGLSPTTRLPPRQVTVAARFRDALRRAAPALLAYAAARLVGLLVLTVWAHRRHHGVWPLLATKWDADWYLGIADHGYARLLGAAYDANNLAFFPLYPVLVKAVAAVTPGTRATTGVAIAVVGSFAAAWGIHAVGSHLHGRRVGVLLTVLWAALPVGLVEWMGYTESLFTAFAAWSLYAVLTGRWLWAGSLAALSGLTRPTGIAVAAAVTVTALLSLRRGFCARALAAVLTAPAGWLAYVGWVGLRLHRWDGYFAVQRLWHNEWDGGTETLRRLRDILGRNSAPELFLVMVTVTLLVSVALYALSLWDRQPLPLLVFTGVLLLIVLGSGGVYFPRARFLLPGFPLLLPAALHLARSSPRFRTVALTGAILLSAYCSAYMALVWPSAP
ncbi:membrane protein [Streptomyces sp. 142MFCol3.1]|uniref:membrane protein n=1 Tax=Streptomyces sp. 142MFCol3.1 TaxID=1172179 RepID=UPI000413D104